VKPVKPGTVTYLARFSLFGPPLSRLSLGACMPTSRQVGMRVEDSPGAMPACRHACLSCARSDRRALVEGTWGDRFWHGPTGGGFFIGMPASRHGTRPCLPCQSPSVLFLSALTRRLGPKETPMRSAPADLRQITIPLPLRFSMGGEAAFLNSPKLVPTRFS